MGSDVKIIPRGSFTQADYQHRYKCGETKSRMELKSMIEKGKLLKTVVRVVYYTPVGKIDPCPTAQKSKRMKKT